MDPIETTKTIENKETIDTVEKVVEKVEEIEKKPKRKLNITEEDRQRRSERMKLARAKKNDELEKNRLLMEEYLKQQEAELEEEILKKLNAKTNKKKKDLESDIIQKKVTEKKATRPAVERSNSEPVAKKQEVATSFFKICK